MQILIYDGTIKNIFRILSLYLVVIENIFCLLERTTNWVLWAWISVGCWRPKLRWKKNNLLQLRLAVVIHALPVSRRSARS